MDSMFKEKFANYKDPNEPLPVEEQERIVFEKDEEENDDDL